MWTRDEARVLAEELRLLRAAIDDAIRAHADLLGKLWIDAVDLFRGSKFSPYLAAYIGMKN